MSKIIYVTKEALRMALNKDYDMKLPKDTNFVLTTESDKEREQNYVADLEAKLAESEKRIELADCIIKQYADKDKNLYLQLAEKDVELNKWSTEYARAYVNRQNDLIAENVKLKQQLAEKTLTIEQINKAFIENRSLWKGKYEQANQDKISFCIEKLDNLKSFIKEKAKFETGDYEIVYSDDILEEIENQIEEIKKENR